MSAFLVAITGASGAIYGVRLVEELLKKGPVELIVSRAGSLVLKEELGVGPGAIEGFLASRGSETEGLSIIPEDDLAASSASGSSLRKTMFICPSSMGTLARVAHGISANLIERAADCVLKERGTLIIVPRETPLNAVHLENMLTLSRAGAVILPAMPAFYHKPASVDDMVDFVVGKALDIAGIEHGLFRRWKKPG